MPDVVTSHENQIEAARDHARTMLAGFTNRAVEVLTEIMELGENDRVRLSAANSVLDRAGVVAPQEIKVSASDEEHQLVKTEAEEVMKRIEANVKARGERLVNPDLETLVVHESEGDTEPA